MKAMTLAICISAAVLAGCSTVPDAAGTVVQEAGAKPTESAAVAAIRAHLVRTLRDPESVKQFAVLKGPIHLEARTAGGAIERAWLMCVEYNAANAYGGFVGVQTHPYVLRDYSGDLTVISPVGWASVSANC